MKLLMTGLISIVLTSWLFAQEKTPMAVNIHPSDGYLITSGDTVISPQSNVPYKADYQMIVEMGFGPGGNDDTSYLLFGEVINGFLISPEFYIGIGTGVRVMSLPNGFWVGTLGSAVVPIYADVRLFLSKGNVSPYLSVDAGYAMDVSFGIEGLGFMIRPMAGLSFGRHKRIPLHLGIGYNSQAVKNHDGLQTVVLCLGITI